jgi:hypothetical protein
MSKLARSDEPKVNQCQTKSKAQILKVLDFELCLPAAGRDFDI